MNPEKYLEATGALFQSDLSFIGFEDTIKILVKDKKLSLTYDDEERKWVLVYRTRYGAIYETIRVQHIDTVVKMALAERAM